MKETSTQLQIILIDDNDIDQLLHRKLIERTEIDVVMHQFTDATKAIAAIRDRSISTDTYKKNIILLDIKMPIMDGFQFLDAFHLLNEEIKSAFTIFILTSSLNQYDISRSKSNPYVKEMVTKPIRFEIMQSLLQ